MRKLGKCSYPKGARLLKREEFSALQIQAKKFANSHFLLLAKHQQLENARLGIVITKKLVRKAVERNRLKRLCRESFRHYRVILPKVDCIIIARKEMQLLSNKELRKKLDREWQNLIAYF